MIIVALSALICLAILVMNTFQKNFSSRFFPWLYANIASPFLLVYVIYEVLENNANYTSTLSQVIFIISCIVLFISLPYLYIRGHIVPIDKNSPKMVQYDEEQLKLVAVKRLLLTGTILTSVSAAVLLISGIAAAPLFFLMVVCIIMAICPALSIFAIIAILMLGPVAAVLFLFFSLTVMYDLIIINGCIRYILYSDITSSQRLRLILLSFIPVFNIFYGIKYLKEISGRLKAMN